MLPKDFTPDVIEDPTKPSPVAPVDEPPPEELEPGEVPSERAGDEETDTPPTPKMIM